MLLLLLFLIATFFLLILWWFSEYYKYSKYLKIFPGPRPLPLLGNALDLQHTTEILDATLRYQSTYGGIVRVTVLFRPLLLVTDHKFLDFVLSSNKLLTKSQDYTSFISWLGTGLLTSTGEKWKKHRKILTPAFHFQILEQFIDVFNSASDILVQKLKNEVGQSSIDIYRYITLCALDIICESAMGTMINAQDNENSDYVKSVKEMCRIVVERSVSPLKNSEFGYYLSKDYQKEKKALKVLHSYTTSVIKRRREKLLNTNDKANSSTSDDYGKKKRLAFLDLLLQGTVDGQPLSDLDIRNEVDTFLFEGHDTTGSAMNFILYCLAHNREPQQKVLEEIKAILSDDFNRTITYRDLQEMKYLEMVIKESLRLYPSVPLFGRRVMEDFEYDGKVIPKGVDLMVSAYGVGRNPEVFPDPEKFDPERFNPNNTLGRNPFAYLPFSAGPRNCIGQKFAMLEMKSTVAKVLKNYELFPTNPPHKLQLAAESVLKSANGICIRIAQRNL